MSPPTVETAEPAAATTQELRSPSRTSADLDASEVMAWLSVLLAGFVCWVLLVVLELSDVSDDGVLTSSLLGLGLIFFVVVAFTTPVVAVARSLVVDGELSLSRTASLAALVGVASPALVLLATGIDLGSADSAVLLSSNALIRSGDLFWLVESQEAVVPHVVYSGLIELGLRPDRLVLVPVALTGLLAVWVGWFSRRVTGSLPIGMLAVIALVAVPPVFVQAVRLPLYPLFTLAGVAAVRYLARWVETGGRRTDAVLGGLGVAVAVATHGAGLYYFPLAIVTVILATDREAVKRWFAAMVLVGLWNMPWLVSHLWVDGLTRVSTPRDSWFLTNGHQLTVNRDFFELPVGTRLETLTSMPQLFFTAAGTLGIPLFVLSVIGLSQLRRRRAVFVVTAVVILWAPLVIARSATFERYYYPVFPGVVILAALGLAWSLDRIRSNNRRLAVLGVGLVFVMAQVLSSLSGIVDRRVAGEINLSELVAAAAIVDDGRAVLGSRSFLVNFIDPQIPTYHHDLLTEDEYLAFYRWDQAGIEELQETYDFGWIVLAEPAERWEERYPSVWLDSLGLRPVHAEVLERRNCVVLDGGIISVYDLDLCLENSPP